MAEFQIIPTYITNEKISYNLVQQLRNNNIKKIYVIKQDIDSNSKLYKNFKELLNKYEIIFHEEEIDFITLNEKKFNYYLKCLKIGKPDGLVVFGSEIGLNVAKLLNYLIGNKKINSFNDFLNQLNNKNDFPLKIFFIANNFTLGSENNFFGILKINKNNKIIRCVFNANSIPTYIFSNAQLFNEISIEEIKYNIASMFIRSIEQYLGNNNFEWTKNYIITNIQSIIDCINKFDIVKSNNKLLDNLIWINYCINNGISNFLSNGDWKFHIFAYELSDEYNINLNLILYKIFIPYLLNESEINNSFKVNLNELKSKLYGSQEDINSFFKNIENIFMKLNTEKDDNTFSKINWNNKNISSVISKTIDKIKLIERNIDETKLTILFNKIISNINN